MALKGFRYKVKDTYTGDYFKPGQVLVALESDVKAYCVPEEKYVEGCNDPIDYPLSDFWAISDYYLEALKNE